jgi:hypothetical protein
MEHFHFLFLIGLKILSIFRIPYDDVDDDDDDDIDDIFYHKANHVL